MTVSAHRHGVRVGRVVSTQTDSMAGHTLSATSQPNTDQQTGHEGHSLAIQVALRRAGCLWAGCGSSHHSVGWAQGHVQPVKGLAGWLVVRVFVYTLIILALALQVLCMAV